MFLGFLLISPTRAFSEAKSCTAAALAWNDAQDYSQFVLNIAHCLNGAKKAYSEIQGIIKPLPMVIEKVLPVARTQGLVLLSVYFLHSSFKLYNDTKTLADNLKIYRDKIEALEIEMKPLRNYIETFILLWKAGNTTNFEKIAEKLLEKIGRPYAVLSELTEAIRQDIKTHGSNQRLSSYFAVCGVLACVGGGALGGPVAVYPCAVAVGTAGYGWLNYSSVNDTLLELERLEKAATTMGQELKRYQSELELAKMTGELYSH